MARLIYSAIMSLDGYTADADGCFEWAAPDEEVHAFVNELERPVGTYLYGRRMYKTMRYWEPRTWLPASRPSGSTSPGSGRRPTRSCIPPRCQQLIVAEGLGRGPQRLAVTHELAADILLAVGLLLADPVDSDPRHLHAFLR
jgi:hypothetical protein